MIIDQEQMDTLKSGGAANAADAATARPDVQDGATDVETAKMDVENGTTGASATADVENGTTSAVRADVQDDAADAVSSTARTPRSTAAAPTAARQRRPTAARAGTPDSGAPAARKLPPDAERILNIRVPVIAQLAERTMPIADIRRMSSGSVIKFATSADGDLELCINNHAIAQGVAVRVGERFGLRITRVGTPEERIRSLGR